VNGLTQIPFCPHTPTRRQRLFLALMGREALYGGAAGGGKSDALIMAALQFVHVRGYNALLLRRTYADLSKPEALMDRARDWFSPYIETHGVRWVDKEKRWLFPCLGGGFASIGFGYIAHENDVENYQGAAYQFVAYDETTHFTLRQYTYLFSRQRRLVGVDIPLRMRAATNPGGVGHAWVMARFGLEKTGRQKDAWTEKRDDGDRVITKRDRPFVPARMDDNPHLDQATYNEQLAELDPTRRAQLADGVWIQDGKQKIFHYQSAYDVQALPYLPDDPSGQLWIRVFIVDLGASTNDRTTSFTRLAYHPYIRDSVFVEFSRKKAGEDPWTIEKACTDAIETCGGDLTIVMDEGALGKGYGNGIRSRHDIPLIPAEKSEKRANTRLLRAAMERGHIHCLAGQCQDLIDEIDVLIFDDDGLDAMPGMPNHCADGLLYGWRWTHAHRGQKPPDDPPEQTPEWWARYEREQRQKDIDAIQEKQAADGFTRW